MDIKEVMKRFDKIEELLTQIRDMSEEQFNSLLDEKE